MKRRGRPMVKRCSRCRLVLPADSFAPNERMLTGLRSRCRSCAAEDNRGWRAAHPEYVANVNAARRAGPFAHVCVDCGIEFAAARRAQVRCSECQVARRRERNTEQKAARRGGEA